MEYILAVPASIACVEGGFQPVSSMESYTKHLFPILIDTRSTVTKRVTILKLNQLWHGRNLSPGTEKTQMEYTKRVSTKKM